MRLLPGRAGRSKASLVSGRNSHAREAVEISERKKSIIGILGNVAELGASRMEETIGTAGLRDAAIGTGIAVDKMLALTGQLPSVQIANVILPTPEEQAKLHEVDAKLDAIFGRLKQHALPTPPRGGGQP